MARPAGQSRAAAAGPVGNQPDHWLAADDGGGQAKVEQRGAAGNMQRAAIRIANPQHPRRVGVQADRLAGRVEPETPRLGVVHRGGHGGCGYQLHDHLLRLVS
jgi:hypothetical protein